MNGGVSRGTTAAPPGEPLLAQPSPGAGSPPFPGGAGKSAGDWLFLFEPKERQEEGLRMKIPPLLFHVYLPNEEHLGREWQVVFSLREAGR